MKFPDGKTVRIGDHVKLWDGCFGKVVAIFDSREFEPGYLKNEWGYLEHGILVESDQAGLIHYLEPEPTMELIRRK